MRKSLALIAVLTGITLLTAFSAEAAEGARAMGASVTQIIQPQQAEQSKLLVSTAVVRRPELEEPLGQKRKDTTSAGIGRSAGEPRRNTPEKVAPEPTAKVSAKREESASKFGIYRSIKEAVLDFFLPSRTKETVKPDISRVQKHARTEESRPRPQPVR